MAEQDIIDAILDFDFLVNQIYDRYEKYKTDKYFYVPFDVLYKNNSLKTDIGDKSYSNFQELKRVLRTWFIDDDDLETFSNCLWNNRNQNIVAMILVETDKYNFGCVILLPISNTPNSRSSIQRLCEASIGPFNHIHSDFMK